MQNQLEFKLVQNFRCKRCGCNHYDKLIYTGMKTLDEENSVIYDKYVCRNCDFPVNINGYLINDKINITSDELLNQSEFIDDGVDFQVDGESIIKENINE